MTELGLPFTSIGWAFLANGSEVSFPVHYGTVVWDGRPRYIRVDVADATPLVGMRLLDGHRVCLDVEDGGRVVIEARA